MAETRNHDRSARNGARWPSYLGLLVVVAVAAALAAAGGTALLVNILERKQEAPHPFYRVSELTDETEEPAVWGKNFPLQYERYLRTTDQGPV